VGQGIQGDPSEVLTGVVAKMARCDGVSEFVEGKGNPQQQYQGD
jgi:hypothetical protein